MKKKALRFLISSQPFFLGTAARVVKIPRKFRLTLNPVPSPGLIRRCQWN
jgi:hypothetical protein